MRLTVLYFASLRDALGRESDVINVKAATIGDVIEALGQENPTWAGVLAQYPNRRLALNQVFATETDLVRDGDELAIFPPITGG